MRLWHARFRIAYARDDRRRPRRSRCHPPRDRDRTPIFLERTAESQDVKTLLKLTSGKVPLEKTIKRQVLPHAPSPTMTSLRLISDMVRVSIWRIECTCRANRCQMRGHAAPEGADESGEVVTRDARRVRKLRGGWPTSRENRSGSATVRCTPACFLWRPVPFSRARDEALLRPPRRSSGRSTPASADASPNVVGRLAPARQACRGSKIRFSRVLTVLAGRAAGWEGERARFPSSKADLVPSTCCTPPFWLHILCKL